MPASYERRTPGRVGENPRPSPRRGSVVGFLTRALVVVRRAWHLAAAAIAPDEAVAGLLAAAAERFAQRTGYLAATYAYERAAELTPAPAQRGERLVAAAEASRLAGRPAHARELLEEAEPLAEDAALRADIALKEAMLEAWLGSVEVAAQRYARIAEEVMESDPDRGAFALLARRRRRSRGGRHRLGARQRAPSGGAALHARAIRVDGVHGPRDARDRPRPARRAGRGCAAPPVRPRPGSSAAASSRVATTWPRRCCGSRITTWRAACSTRCSRTRARSATCARSPPRSRCRRSSTTAPATGAPLTRRPRSPCGCRPTPSSPSSSHTASACSRSSRRHRAGRPRQRTPRRPTRSPHATASR